MIQADGGTRTAAITGAFVAARDAINGLLASGALSKDPILDHIAAISVGIYQGHPVADLDYDEDSNCDTDMNIVMTGKGGIVEIQGTAEGASFSRDELIQLLDLGQHAIGQLIVLQHEALAK